MIINHNMASLNTYNKLSTNNTNSAKSLEKLSSGLRINKAGDDAAGLAISEKMRGQIRGLDQSVRNAQDGISLINTAEGALSETHSILQRMRELAVQSSNDTNTSNDRSEIQKEVNQLKQEIDRVANTTEFNTQKLLDGSKVGLTDKIAGSVNLQNNSSASVTAVGTTLDSITQTGTFTITRTSEAAASLADFTVADPNGIGLTLNATTTTITGTGTDITLTNLLSMKSGESVTISVGEMKAATTDTSKAINLQIGANSGQNMLLGINSMKASDLGVANGSDGIDVSSATKATAAITSIENAITKVSAERSKFGAYQNRLDHTISNLGTSSENLTAAESRVRDVDMAKEMMSFQKNNILSQAAQAMLAQANQAPQGVLQLLR